MTDRNRNRPGYKETKVGWIPKEWKFLRYEEAFSTIIDGTHFSPRSTSGPRRYITSRNIKYGSMDFRNCAWISEEEHLSIYKRCPVKHGQLLLTKDGAKAGNACINPLTEDFSLLSSVAVLDGRTGTTINIFALQWILSPRGQFSLLSEVSGQAITRLTLDIISSVHIPLPPLPEQKAIAEVLSCWDEGIEKLDKLIDTKKLRKKGLMQKLLTGEIRLPGFFGDWKEKRLGDVFDRITRKNKIGCTNNLTISGAYGLINQEEFFNKRVAAHDTSGYYLLKNGEFAYNKSYCNGYPLGAIKRLDRYEEGAVSTLYICFSLKKNAADSEFMTQYFENGELNHGIYRVAQEGARNHGLLNITATDFFSTQMIIPSTLDEQKAIAEVLETADEEIRLLEVERDALAEQKKGLMQKLLTGEIRCPEFRGEQTYGVES